MMLVIWQIFTLVRVVTVILMNKCESAFLSAVLMINLFFLNVIVPQPIFWVLQPICTVLQSFLLNLFISLPAKMERSDLIIALGVMSNIFESQNH